MPAMHVNVYSDELLEEGLGTGLAVGCGVGFNTGRELGCGVGCDAHETVRFNSDCKPVYGGLDRQGGIHVRSVLLYIQMEMEVLRPQYEKGRGPLSMLLSKCNCCKLVSKPNSVGTVPVKELEESKSFFTLVSRPSSDGRVPESLFEDSSSHVKAPSPPIDRGRWPPPGVSLSTTLTTRLAPLHNTPAHAFSPVLQGPSM